MTRMIDLGTKCAKCGQWLIENPDRCGDMSCKCHEFHWVHPDTLHGLCD
jgi:hypothetical protein